MSGKRAKLNRKKAEPKLVGTVTIPFFDDGTLQVQNFPSDPIICFGLISAVSQAFQKYFAGQGASPILTAAGGRQVAAHQPKSPATGPTMDEIMAAINENDPEEDEALIADLQAKTDRGETYPADVKHKDGNKREGNEI